MTVQKIGLLQIVSRLGTVIGILFAHIFGVDLDTVAHHSAP